MNQEHSIDDILKLLKESVKEDEAQKKSGSVKTQTAHVLSEEELKQQLKKQYAHEESVECEESPYAFDASFLDETKSTDSVEEAPAMVVEEPTVQSVVATEESEDLEAPWEEVAEETVLEKSEEEAILEEVVEESDAEAETDVWFEEAEDIAPWDDALEPRIDLTASEDPQSISEHFDEAFVSDEDLLLNEVIPQDQEEETMQESLLEDEPFEEEIFPEIKTLELTDLLCDYESEEDPTAEAFSFSDSSRLLEELSQSEEEKNGISADQLHESVLDLMVQLGCEEEMETAWEDGGSDDLRAESSEMDALEKEARRSDQTEAIFRSYQKQKIKGLISLLGTALLTVLIFLYDTLPLFGVEFSGIISHLDYPSAYMMIGFQLLLVCALFLGKALWLGAKKIVTLRPDLYSVVALLMICTFLYDLTMMLIPHSDFPPMFHFLTALMMLSAMIGEYALLIRETKIFSVYSTELGERQYTLRESKGSRSIAEQMYDGGLDRSKSVYVPWEVDFPTGVFTSMREDVIGNRWISLAMLPIVLVSMLAMVVAMILNSNVEIAAIAAITVLFTALPLHAAFAICIPLCTSASRLQKRGIGVNGKKNMDRYADGALMVYNDLHLFRPCTAKDTGIVFYEEDQSMTVLACLEKLYSQIGGPLSEVFSNIPEAYRFHKIRIRRIFRSGLEVFVEKKHILLVGDVEFMRRYGLIFPKSEEKKGRATLCVSLDGKVSAKMSVKYTIEPIFEMLVERLAKEGIEVVIETFDPMIQASLIASVRTMGHAPISVFHKNVSYLYQKEFFKFEPSEAEILATSSRLKLAEAVVWCKRLFVMRRRNNILTGVFSGLGIVFVALALIFGWMASINQYWLLLFSVFPHVAILILSLNMMPKKNYFTVEACEADLRKMQQKNVHKRKQKKKERNKHE